MSYLVQLNRRNRTRKLFKSEHDRMEINLT